MRRVIYLTALLVAVSVLVSCDNDLIMDLMPPQPGFLWRVCNAVYRRINKIHPVTGEVFGGPQPNNYEKMYGITSGDGKLWVSAFNDVNDPYDDYYAIWEAYGDTEFRVPSSGGLAYDGENIWLTHRRTVYRVDPVTEDSELMYGLDNVDIYCTGLNYHNASLWLLSYKYYATPPPPPIIIQIDPADGSVLSTLDCPVSNPRGLAWDGEAFWTNDYDTGRIYRFDPKDGSVLGYLEPDDIWAMPLDQWGLCFEPVEETR
ncbi:MAG: hypothetical protein GY771_14025 [bacterium]|nr:hypothetical protein [bacterium]